MSKSFIIVLCLYFLVFKLSAQITLKGKVFFENKPISNASVYINNTTVGTITNANGEFTLHLNSGIYQLVVSHIGFKTIVYKLDTSIYTKPLVFYLSEDSFVLDEVAIVVKQNNAEWLKNYYYFINAFFGTTKFARSCSIANRDALFFDLDKERKTLTARANESLIIRNKALGYEIVYDLEHFSIENSITKYKGYAHFKELVGGESKSEKWKKNRLEAYKGSHMHFYRSALNNTTREEGFVIHQFIRKKNFKSPSQEELLEARRIFASSNESFDNRVFRKSIVNPKNAVDSSIVTIKKSFLPKYNDYLYSSDINSSDIIIKKDSMIHLQFENNLKIAYLNEKEERGYIIKNSPNKFRKAFPQSSNIIPLTNKLMLYPQGILASPLNVLYEGYWSYEKFAHSLPLDYKPDD